MTVSTEITRLKTSIANAYDALEAKGATMPTIENPDNLADAIESITGGGEQIEATNNTGSNISEGDKVWIEPSGNDYNLINLRYTYNDFTVIGSPNINTSTGIVSGFSSSNYLTLPQSLNPADKSWEVRLKFTTSNNINSTQGIFQSIIDYTESGQRGIILLIVNGKSRFGISTNGSSWLFITDSSFNLATNTTYWVKFGWTGTEYYLEYSTDGINYTRDITENSSIPAYSSSNYTVLGIYSWSIKEGFLGTLDLSECYIKVNNSIWWNPRVIQISEDAFSGFAQENIASGSTGLVNIGTIIDQSEIIATNNTGSNILKGDKVWIESSGENHNLINFRSAYSNFTVVGSPSINISTGVVTGFSINNYLQLPEPFNPGENPWEMIIKIRTGADLQIWQEIFHSSVAPNDSGRYGLSVMIDSGNFELDISTDGSSWIGADRGTFVLSENTDYWVKVGWNSNEYYLEYSTNGVDYTRDITYTFSNHLPNLTNSWVGIYRNSAYMYPMLGTIDLSDCYIKINGLEWWNPRVISITEDTLTGFAQENIANGSTGFVNVGTLIEPTGSITITENGTHNVADYAEAVVNVTSGDDLITATNNTGSAITEGDKVWINQEDGENRLENYLVYITNTESVGNVIVSDNIASNFSSSNYLKTIPSFNVSSTDSWEICMCFDITSSTSTSLGTYISSFEEYGYGPYIAILNTGTMNATIANNSSIITGFNGPAYQLNQRYWIKLSYKSGVAKGEYSTNGIDFIEMGSGPTSITGISINRQMWLGYCRSGTNLPGNIYLDGCYIKINDEKIWEGYKGQIIAPESAQTGIAAESISIGATGLVNVGAVINTNSIIAINSTGSAISKGDKVWIKPTGNNYNLINFSSTPVYDNFTTVGSLTVNTSTGVVSGFSQSNYLQLPQAFNPDNNPWDVYVSFNKPLSQVSNNTQIISTSGFQLGINMNAYFWLWVWDKDGNGICDSALNLTYSNMPEHTMCHIYFTGSEYKVDYSVDSISWINIYQNTLSVACRSSDVILIGNAASESYRSEYFRGSVDLSGTYIKISDSIWWTPRAIQITENTITGYAKENISINGAGLVNVASEVL